MTTSLYAFKTDSDEGSYDEFSYEQSYEYDDSSDDSDDSGGDYA